MHLPNGKVTWYRQGLFTCLCQNPNHQKCILSRSSRPGRKPAQGRPLGLMAAWLEKGMTLPDKASHWGPLGWPTFEERSTARRALMQMASAVPLLAEESGPKGLARATSPKSDPRTPGLDPAALRKRLSPVRVSVSVSRFSTTSPPPLALACFPCPIFTIANIFTQIRALYSFHRNVFITRTAHLVWISLLSMSSV